jgi:hypothetical protein
MQSTLAKRGKIMENGRFWQSAITRQRVDSDKLPKILDT